MSSHSRLPQVMLLRPSKLDVGLTYCRVASAILALAPENLAPIPIVVLQRTDVNLNLIREATTAADWGPSYPAKRQTIAALCSPMPLLLSASISWPRLVRRGGRISILSCNLSRRAFTSNDKIEYSRHQENIAIEIVAGRTGGPKCAALWPSKQRRIGFSLSEYASALCGCNARAAAALELSTLYLPLLQKLQPGPGGPRGVPDLVRCFWERCWIASNPAKLSDATLVSHHRHRKLAV
jgi:hypothetical protein